MLKKDRFTATEIAEVLCRADDLVLEDHATTHNRLRYLAKRDMLPGGVSVDARGTKAFPTIAVYRAAIYAELMALAMDTRALEAVVTAAELKGSRPFAPSQAVEGGFVDRGGLLNAIRGVAAGEDWTLTIAQKMPGMGNSALLEARFEWDGAAQSKAENARIDAILGSKPGRTRVTVELAPLFLNVIAQVGMPD